VIFTSQLAVPGKGAVRSTVKGVALCRLPHFRDARGLLSVAESGDHIPFEVRRVFVVTGVTGPAIRGDHAHLTLRQMLLCVHGGCEVTVDDGENRQSFVLDDPTLAILIPPMVWSLQHSFTPDAVLLVLASEKYDPVEYIRDYDEFLARVKAPH